MAYSAEFISKIRSCGIVKYVSQFTELKKVGSVLQGRCPHPDHNDSNPSFTIWKDSKTGLESWCCMGCHSGKKGNHGGARNFGSDNIALVQWLSAHKASNHTYTFREAIAILADFYNIPLERPQNQKLLTENKGKAVRYYQALRNNLGAISYLQQRGLDAEDISKWAIGYDEYHNRITFPVINRDFEVLGFSNRYIGQNPDECKYWNDPKNEVFDKGRLLYGIQFIDQSCSYIYITEGQMDTILATKYGLKNVVASMTCTLTEHQIELIVKSGMTPVLCYDADAAGQEGTKAVLRRFYEAGCRQMEVLPMPAGLDMADLANKLRNNLPLYVETHKTKYSKFLLDNIAKVVDEKITAIQMAVMPDIEKALSCISDPCELQVMKSFIKKRLHLWLE